MIFDPNNDCIKNINYPLEITEYQYNGKEYDLLWHNITNGLLTKKITDLIEIYLQTYHNEQYTQLEIIRNKLFITTNLFYTILSWRCILLHGIKVNVNWIYKKYLHKLNIFPINKFNEIIYSLIKNDNANKIINFKLLVYLLLKIL